MLASVPLVISAVHTAGSLRDELSIIGAEALLKVLIGLARGEITPTPQPSEGVTYAGKIEKSEARIDWARQAGEIERQIRAFNPWPVAETLLDGAQLRIYSARTSPIAGEDGAKSAEPGTILGLGMISSPSAAAKGCWRSPRSSSPGASRSARATSRTPVRCRVAALARTPWAPGAPALAAAARAIEAVASGGQFRRCGAGRGRVNARAGRGARHHPGHAAVVPAARCRRSSRCSAAPPA